jgi:hypothetical protein
MASQAAGEPTNVRESGRKRNASTYATTSVPLIVGAMTTSSGLNALSPVSTTTVTISNWIAKPIATAVSVNLTLYKIGKYVHAFQTNAIVVGTSTNGVGFESAVSIPEEYRPSAASITVPLNVVDDGVYLPGSCHVTNTGVIVIDRHDAVPQFTNSGACGFALLNLGWVTA